MNKHFYIHSSKLLILHQGRRTKSVGPLFPQKSDFGYVREMFRRFSFGQVNINPTEEVGERKEISE